MIIKVHTITEDILREEFNKNSWDSLFFRVGDDTTVSVTALSKTERNRTEESVHSYWVNRNGKFTTVRTLQDVVKVCNGQRVKDSLALPEDDGTPTNSLVTRLIVTKEMDGTDENILVLAFECLPGTNIHQAVRSAVKYFMMTDEGKEVYERNGRSFNWGDFDTYVTDDICQMFGFRYTGSACEVSYEDFNDQLITEAEFDAVQEFLNN